MRAAIMLLSLVGLGWLLHETLPVRPRCAIRGPGLHVSAVWPDGQRLATLSFATKPRVLTFDGGPLEVWSTKTGELLGRYLENTTVAADSVVYSKDHQFFAAFVPSDPNAPRLGRDAERNLTDVVLVDLVNGGEWPAVTRAEHELGLPEFSPHGRFLTLQTLDTQGSLKLTVIECASGREAAGVATLHGYHSFAPNDSQVYFAQFKYPYCLGILDISKRQVVRCIPEIPAGWIPAPDGRTVLASLDRGTAKVVGDGHLTLWNLSNSTKQDLRVYHEPVYDAVFSQDSAKLAVRLGDRIEIWSTATGKQDAETMFGERRTDPLTIVLSPDSRFLATFPSPPQLPVDVAKEGAFVLWDVATGAKLWERSGKISSHRWPVFAADTGFLLDEPDWLGPINVLDAFTGKIARSIPVTGRRLARPEQACGPRLKIIPTPMDMQNLGEFWPAPMSGDGRRITVLSVRHQTPGAWRDWFGKLWHVETPEWSIKVTVVDITTGKELFHYDRPGLLHAVLSADGRTVVTEEEENGERVIRCWDVPFNRPWLLIVGIPAALGIAITTMNWFRKRRRRVIGPAANIIIREGPGCTSAAAGRQCADQRQPAHAAGGVAEDVPAGRVAWSRIIRRRP